MRGRRRCHFLHPRRGLLVIEVKDWKLENIRPMDKLTATLQVDGREVRKSNPLEQAKQYAFGVCRLLESDPALVGEPGSSFQGKLVFPWGYGVVLANISRKAFAGTDLGNVIPPERVICQDEMVESVDAEAFQQRLWGMFGVTFRCRVMDLQQEQLARTMGGAELGVCPLSFLRLGGGADARGGFLERALPQDRFVHENEWVLDACRPTRRSVLPLPRDDVPHAASGAGDVAGSLGG